MSWINNMGWKFFRIPTAATRAQAFLNEDPLEWPIPIWWRFQDRRGPLHAGLWRLPKSARVKSETLRGVCGGSDRRQSSANEQVTRSSPRAKSAKKKQNYQTV